MQLPDSGGIGRRPDEKRINGKLYGRNKRRCDRLGGGPTGSWGTGMASDTAGMVSGGWTGRLLGAAGRASNVARLRL